MHADHYVTKRYICINHCCPNRTQIIYELYCLQNLDQKYIYHHSCDQIYPFDHYRPKIYRYLAINITNYFLLQSTKIPYDR